MPNIRKLIEDGVTFTSSVTLSLLCTPAYACLITGHNYKNCRVLGNNINYDPNLRTFYSILKESGYTVGGIGKFDLNRPSMS